MFASLLDFVNFSSIYSLLEKLFKISCDNVLCVKFHQFYGWLAKCAATQEATEGFSCKFEFHATFGDSVGS